MASCPSRALLRAVADRILLAAMEGYRPDGDWKQRIIALAQRLREAFCEQPQLAAVWGRYASGGTGSRLVLEDRSSSWNHGSGVRAVTS